MKNKHLVEAMPGYRWEIDESNFVKVIYRQDADLVVFSDEGICHYAYGNDGEKLMDFLDAQSLPDVGTVKNGGWIDVTPSTVIPWSLAAEATDTNTTTNTTTDTPTLEQSTTTTSYTFRVLNNDGTEFGKGCFTIDGEGDPGIPYRKGVGGPLTAFWYSDPIVGVLDINSLLVLGFSDEDWSRQFQFNAWAPPHYTDGLVAGVATPDQLGNVSAHGSMTENAGCQGRKLEWVKVAQPTIETIEDDGVTIPLVDLVVVIDSSVSMKDEAVALDGAVSAAIEAARAHCPSDLRVVYLGIEGTFRDTRFNQTIRNYLTTTASVDVTQLRGRQRGTVAGGGAQEDGARAIEDLSRYFDWRTGAGRALFFLGDESLDAGNQDAKQDQGDIEAANTAIAVATEAKVRVHTYLGTSSVKEKMRKAIEAEYARVAQETGGQSFTSQDALRGFQALLQDVICGSKPAPRTIEHPFCCCQAYAES